MKKFLILPLIVLANLSAAHADPCRPMASSVSVGSSFEVTIGRACDNQGLANYYVSTQSTIQKLTVQVSQTDSDALSTNSISVAAWNACLAKASVQGLSDVQVGGVEIAANVADDTGGTLNDAKEALASICIGN